jgi:deoxyribodipyrimidine photolyase-related protein
LPVTRQDALAWFSRFLSERLTNFGAYEDAMTSRSATVFHGVLSPLMNVGLLTPREIVDEALVFAQQHDVPLNSTEGFIRQVVGWREFVRAVYRKHGAWQTQQNHFGHQRELTSAWYEARTGIPPLDDLIRKAQRMGWAHHIERLMVAGNIMTLAEIQPRSAYGWFMEMFVDSSDWVMVPNVFGMALFADGGLMTTKPYICGSGYILRMSDYEAPRELSGQTQWVDVLDGLYWRFVDRQRATIGANVRTAMMVKAFANLQADRKVRIFAAAEAFLQRYTRPATGA